MADRFMHQDAGPARAQQHRHLARGRRDRAHVDARLRQRLVDRAVPHRLVHHLVVEIAAADAEHAGFAATIFLQDDGDVEPHQRANIGRGETVRADDLHHRPAARQAYRYLRDARIPRAGGGVDLGAERDLLGEGHDFERVGVGIEMAIGALRGRSGLSLGGIEQGERLRRLGDRRFAQVIGMGKAGHLARHAAQTKARIGRIVGGLQSTVVEAEALARAILQIEFAVVALAERLRGQAARAIGIEQAGTVEEAAGVGEQGCGIGHAPDIGAHRPDPNRKALEAGARRDVRLRGDIGRVRDAADQHEATVAIAAIDIAMLVDFQEHARVAERGGNVPRTVTGNAGLGDSDDFGRLDHGKRN